MQLFKGGVDPTAQRVSPPPNIVQGSGNNNSLKYINGEFCFLGLHSTNLLLHHANKK